MTLKESPFAIHHTNHTTQHSRMEVAAAGKNVKLSVPLEGEGGL